MLRFCILSFLSLLLLGCTDYDPDTADTEANRKGFARHFGFQPNTEVKAVYYFADELGADVRYQLSFECPEEIAKKIIKKLSLSPKPEGHRGLAPRDDFKWWDADSVNTLPMWMKSNSEQYYWEFWYSTEDGIAYFQEYSI